MIDALCLLVGVTGEVWKLDSC